MDPVNSMPGQSSQQSLAAKLSKNALSVLLKGLLLVAPCYVMTMPEPAGAQSARGGFFIRNLESGKCIDVVGTPGRNNGAPLALHDCEYSGFFNGTPTDQRWYMSDEGFIVNQLSRKCIDVGGSPGTENGATLNLWTCERSGFTSNGEPTDQLWNFYEGFFINQLSGRCIDVVGTPGTENGSPLALHDCEFSGFDLPTGSPTDHEWEFVRFRN